MIKLHLRFRGVVRNGTKSRKVTGFHLLVRFSRTTANFTENGFALKMKYRGLVDYLVQDFRLIPNHVNAHPPSEYTRLFSSIIKINNVSPLGPTSILKEEFLASMKMRGTSLFSV